MKRIAALVAAFACGLNIAASFAEKDWTELVAWSLVLLWISRDAAQS